MKNKIVGNVGLLFLAIIFSAGLIFAFIELPRLLDELLSERVAFPGFDQGAGDVNAFKAELFIQGLHLRWFGYGSLLLILLLIVIGYATKRSGWALAGAVGLFIPVFGQFALSMFFLAGLGLLRVGWLPFLEVSSFDLLDLGKVIYVPYWILMWLLGLFKWNAHTFLTYLFMGAGSFMFTWGVLVWLRSRFGGKKVASSWIYRISRHPQYLGWIIWSYGFILFTPFINQMKKTWGVPSSLPWLLMTMVIIGICMMEEVKMMKVTGGAYQEYRSRAPFLLPLPGWLNRGLTWPARLVTGGGYPARPSQVVWIVLIYTVILMALSLFWVDFKKGASTDASPAVSGTEMAEIMTRLDEMGDNRRGIWPLVTELPRYGQAGMDTLILLSRHENPVIREFAIQVLGEQRYQEAEPVIVNALSDSVLRVRSAGIQAAGNIGSRRAVDNLIYMMKHPEINNQRFLICGALGSIGDPKAIPCLAEALDLPEFYNQTAALNAIMAIDPDTGVAYAIKELRDENPEVRRNAVITCIRSGDPAVKEPLGSMLGDEDFEVRLYAKQGLKRFEND